eukprot:352927-Chlamydomonas_euryale.AAC.6
MCNRAWHPRPNPHRRPKCRQRLEAELKQSYATKNFTLKSGLLEMEKAHRARFQGSAAGADVEDLWSDINSLLVEERDPSTPVASARLKVWTARIVWRVPACACACVWARSARVSGCVGRHFPFTRNLPSPPLPSAPYWRRAAAQSARQRSPVRPDSAARTPPPSTHEGANGATVHEKVLKLNQVGSVQGDVGESSFRWAAPRGA